MSVIFESSDSRHEPRASGLVQLITSPSDPYVLTDQVHGYLDIEVEQVHTNPSSQTKTEIIVLRYATPLPGCTPNSAPPFFDHGMTRQWPG